jgi:L-ascorbate metabolism protein UlaG (beta-lactamase superfamily)
MRLIKYSHACVRIESTDAVIVIDPGGWSEAAALDGVDAVLITHEHADHVDADAVARALRRRPQARVFTSAAVAAMLGDLGDMVTTVGAGDAFEAAGMPVRAYGGLHAEIHPEIPRVPNLGYLVAGSVYHPGDSFDVPMGATVDTLFVPISGPWLRLADSVEFIRTIAPRRAFALHDCLLSDVAIPITTALIARLAQCDYARLSPGEAVLQL